MTWLLDVIRTGITVLSLHLARLRDYYLGGLVVLLIGGALLHFFICPPQSFPSGKILIVHEGASVTGTAETLKEEGVIPSVFAFKAFARLFGVEDDIQAGKYLFEKPMSIFGVLHRLAKGISGIPTVRVTFPEGTSSREMAQILRESLPGFDADTFEVLARPHEGYLFPDTYDLYADTPAEDVVLQLTSTFEEKKEILAEELAASNRSLEEIVIMASLIEKEAKTAEDRRIISGILWSRVDIGMALQVDAVFGYIKGRDTYHPSFEDLEIDSPYNTYTNPGLPPGPIANPGLDALVAALEPTETEYLYYLTGTDGTMYYAKTFEGHKENRALYLD